MVFNEGDQVGSKKFWMFVLANVPGPFQMIMYMNRR